MASLMNGAGGTADGAPDPRLQNDATTTPVRFKFLPFIPLTLTLFVIAS